jgi:hypothetical protein
LQRTQIASRLEISFCSQCFSILLAMR